MVMMTLIREIPAVEGWGCLRSLRWQKGDNGGFPGQCCGCWHHGLHSAMAAPKLRADRIQTWRFPMTFYGTAPNIQDVTAKTNTHLRHGTRAPTMIDAAVLHQTAFTRGNTPELYLTINAHFVVLPNGLILHLHPIAANLWASNAFNDVGIAIEFVGNFPTEKGVWWEGNTYGRHTPTRDQINSGRDLLRHLVNAVDIDFVFAHRQGYVSECTAQRPGSVPVGAAPGVGFVTTGQSTLELSRPRHLVWRRRMGTGKLAAQRRGQGL